MKKRLSKLIAFLLIFAIALPIFGTAANAITAQAASPALNVTSKKVYLGTTYQLQLKNVDEADVESVKWRINRKSICKIDQTGLLTPVKYGTTTAFCDITFKDGKETTLKCTVYVRNRVQAKAVTITNKTDVGTNYRELYIGNAITIKKTVTPSSGVTDTAYYVSSDESVATVSTKGVITGKAEGIAMIEVRYGSSKTDAMRADNTAVDKMFVHVVEKPVPTATPTPLPTATPTPTPVIVPEVTSVKMVGSQEIEITFSEAVSKPSLISEGKLVTGTILIGRDVNALDYGVITPSLSKDGKTLSLKLAGMLNGIYSVVVSSKVQSSRGPVFEQYAEVVNWKDTKGPIYTGTTVGYTGWECNVNFDESIDISNMTIEGVTGTTDAYLHTYLSDVSNYKLSADKKSIVVNLSAMINTNKTISASVKLRGIMDSAGNSTANLIQSVSIKTDMTTKPNATIVSTERVSKTQIAVTYSNAILSAGTATFGTTGSLGTIIKYGVVDPEDPTVVYYDIPDAYQTQTTSQIVTFNDWWSYNASGAQTSPVVKLVSFMLDTSAPQLESYSMVNAVEGGKSVAKLRLTYNKDIIIASTQQYFSVKASNTNGNIYTIGVTSESAVIEENTVTYIFGETELLGSGLFQFTLVQGMVADKLSNYSASTVISVAKDTTVNSELPAPVSATQDVTELNAVYLNFANKLDLASAEQAMNYYILDNGLKIYPLTATVVTQDEAGATVKLAFAEGSFVATTAAYELVINGVSGYNGTYTAISDAHVLFTAVENASPKVSGGIRITDLTTITINMSEEVTGSIKILATDLTSGAAINGTGYATGQKSIYVVLDAVPTSSAVKFIVTENEIYDLQGNKADFTVNTTYVATKN